MCNKLLYSGVRYFISREQIHKSAVQYSTMQIVFPMDLRPTLLGCLVSLLLAHTNVADSKKPRVKSKYYAVNAIYHLRFILPLGKLLFNPVCLYAKLDREDLGALANGIMNT